MGDGTSGSGMEELSAELLRRLTKEVGRPSAEGGTALVGGVVKAGSKLEDLLRAVVVAASEFERCAPEALLASVGGPNGPKPKLAKAMAGPLAYGLVHRYKGKPVSAIPAFARPLVLDLVSEDSAIRTFIDIRNQVAKTNKDPEGARPATARLAKVVAAFREENGWT